MCRVFSTVVQIDLILTVTPRGRDFSIPMLQVTQLSRSKGLARGLKDRTLLQAAKGLLWPHVFLPCGHREADSGAAAVLQVSLHRIEPLRRTEGGFSAAQLHLQCLKLPWSMVGP